MRTQVQHFNVLSYWLTSCVNLPVPAPSLCTDSPPSRSDSLSLTAPHAAPILTESTTSTITTTLTLIKRPNAAEIHLICLPCMIFAVLVFSSSAFSSFCLWNGETSTSLWANHLHSNIPVPWANWRIITGSREQERFVNKMLLLMRPVSRCPRGKHATVQKINKSTVTSETGTSLIKCAKILHVCQVSVKHLIALFQQTFLWLFF